MTTYRYPNQGGMSLESWTKPDGTPRRKPKARWLCPKCNEYVEGGMVIKTHRETCRKEA